MLVQRTVRNLASTLGWVGTVDSSLKVLSKPAAFGATDYHVRSGDDHIKFTQEYERGRTFKIEWPTVGQLRIINILTQHGVFAHLHGTTKVL